MCLALALVRAGLRQLLVRWRRGRLIGLEQQPDEHRALRKDQVRAPSGWALRRVLPLHHQTAEGRSVQPAAQS